VIVVLVRVSVSLVSSLITKRDLGWNAALRVTSLSSIMRTNHRVPKSAKGLFHIQHDVSDMLDELYVVSYFGD
jgi:hypothetical protein